LCRILLPGLKWSASRKALRTYTCVIGVGGAETCRPFGIH
jgi:hypothetical protein